MLISGNLPFSIAETSWKRETSDSSIALDGLKYEDDELERFLNEKRNSYNQGGPVYPRIKRSYGDLQLYVA